MGILGHEWEYHKVTRHLMEDSLRPRPDTADFKAGKLKSLVVRVLLYVDVHLCICVKLRKKCFVLYEK